MNFTWVEPTVEGSASTAAAQRAEGAVVGAVADLWRYPVKSMLGERKTELHVTKGGCVGDRAWALRELREGRIASAKKFPRLLEFRAAYEVEPTSTSAGRVIIETPGGETIRPEDANASELVSRLLEHPMRFESQPRSEEKTGIDPGSVFGDVPVEQMKEDWTPETMPDYFQLKSGSFFEIGSVFLLASGSVEHLQRLQGGTAQIDQRRFRPNLYIDSESKDQFVEDAWLGGSLAIGSELVLHEFQPTLWCVTSTLAQEDLPRDLSILRATAQHHKGCLGVYAAIHSPGTVHVGDRVVLNR